jgi:hypothetical protein
MRNSGFGNIQTCIGFVFRNTTQFQGEEPLIAQRKRESVITMKHAQTFTSTRIYAPGEKTFPKPYSGKGILLAPAPSTLVSHLR